MERGRVAIRDTATLHYSPVTLHDIAMLIFGDVSSYQGYQTWKVYRHLTFGHARMIKQ